MYVAVGTTVVFLMQNGELSLVLALTNFFVVVVTI